MEKLLTIIGTLIHGGKFAGLTLTQIIAITEVIQDNEPLIEELIAKGLPLANKIDAVIKESYGKPAPKLPWAHAIPGYDGEAEVRDFIASLRRVWPP